MIFLAVILVAAVSYCVAAIASSLRSAPKRKHRAKTDRGWGRPRQASPLQRLDVIVEGPAWTALDDLQLKRLLKDAAS
jgi:hypothetical protein